MASSIGNVEKVVISLTKTGYKLYMKYGSLIIFHNFLATHWKPNIEIYWFSLFCPPLLATENLQNNLFRILFYFILLWWNFTDKRKTVQTSIYLPTSKFIWIPNKVGVTTLKISIDLNKHSSWKIIKGLNPLSSLLFHVYGRRWGNN